MEVLGLRDTCLDGVGSRWAGEGKEGKLQERLNKMGPEGKERKSSVGA